MVVNTILRTDCACPGCHVENSSQSPSTGDSEEIQKNGREENDVEANLDLIEEVAESVGNMVGDEANILRPNADDLAGTNGGENNDHCMQLIALSGNNNVRTAIRDLRLAEHACSSMGRGTVSPMEVNNVHAHILNSISGHQIIIGLSKAPLPPLASFSLMPQIPRNLSQSNGHESSLSLVPHKKKHVMGLIRITGLKQLSQPLLQ